MKVEFTFSAEQDLRNVAEFIAENDVTRAASFAIEIEQACLGLADHPMRFALVAGHEKTGIRRRVYGKYLIFYRVEDDCIQILHILNGAMDYQTVLFGGAD